MQSRLILLTLPLIFFGQSNSRIVETTVLSNNTQEVILYGDHHHIPSRDQVSAIKNKFYNLSLSNFKSNQVKIYWEGFTMRTNENVCNWPGANSDILYFINCYGRNGSKSFIDIDCRKHNLIMDEIYFAQPHLNHSIQENNQYYGPKLDEAFSEEIKMLKSKLRKLFNRPKAFTLINSEIFKLEALNKMSKIFKGYNFFNNPNAFYNNYLLANQDKGYFKTLDINFLIDIFQKQNNTKKSILFAGALHTRNIESLLLKLGYQVKDKIYSEDSKIFNYIN